MSLVKYLQSVIAPSAFPWIPLGDAAARRFINEIVLEEESDETQIPGEYSSHFELYHRAMVEIGADTAPSLQFVRKVETRGVEKALEVCHFPLASKVFTKQTFQFINSNKPHRVAAAFSLGREHIVPCMFHSILQRIGVTEDEAPTFYFYLNRHIHLDEDHHAPLSMRLLNELCDDDEIKIHEAIEAAHAAVNARLKFWDGVLQSITTTKKTLKYNNRSDKSISARASKW